MFVVLFFKTVHGKPSNVHVQYTGLKPKRTRFKNHPIYIYISRGRVIFCIARGFLAWFFPNPYKYILCSAICRSAIYSISTIQRLFWPLLPPQTKVILPDTEAAVRYKKLMRSLVYRVPYDILYVVTFTVSIKVKS